MSEVAQGNTSIVGNIASVTQYKLRRLTLKPPTKVRNYRRYEFFTCDIIIFKRSSRVVPHTLESRTAVRISCHPTQIHKIQSKSVQISADIPSP
jgi:hypothetical protein